MYTVIYFDGIRVITEKLENIDITMVLCKKLLKSSKGFDVYNLSGARILTTPEYNK